MRRWCIRAAALILALVGCNGEGGGDTGGGGTVSTKAATDVSFGGGNAHQVTDAIERAGVQLCNPTRLRDIDYERKQYDMFLGTCSSDETRDGVLLIETFTDPDLLAKAGPGGPQGQVGYHWAQFQVSVLPGAQPEAIALFRETMNEFEGAEPAFGRR